MKRYNARQMAYWFLKTGKLPDVDSTIQPLSATRKLTRLVGSESFDAGIDYWLKKFKENGMSFTLRDAEHSVDVVLSDLRSRMLSATSSEYEMYAKMYLAMMSIFGGNWSGYENVSDTTNFNDNRIFQGDPKYLGESIEAEVIDGNNGGQ